jgi:hypothetical protein
VAEDQRRELIVQAVDDVIAKHDERVDARKEEDLAFLRTLRASLLGRLREVSKARKGPGS